MAISVRKIQHPQKKSISVWVFSVLTAYLLLSRSSTVSQGIRDGMQLCVEVVIPSLFPFLVFTSFLMASGFAQRISSAIFPVTRYLFRLPQQTGACILMSLIGGYPVGGRMIARLMQQQKLSRQDAERMLCFCINAGPSFVLTAVGVRLFGNAGIGILLLSAHLLASVTAGIWTGRHHPIPELVQQSQPSQPSLTGAMVTAVRETATGMLTLSAFIVLFSAITALLQPICSQLGVWGSTLVSGLLEVTQGCVAASQLPSITGELFAAFFLSFSGISVVCQVISGFGAPVDPAKILFWRLINGIFSTGWYALLRFCFGALLETTDAVASWAYIASTPVLHSSGVNTPMTICLLGVCAIAALTLDDKQNGNG